jgi:hypothetical protein
MNFSFSVLSSYIVLAFIVIGGPVFINGKRGPGRRKVRENTALGIFVKKVSKTPLSVCEINGNLRVY